MDDIRRDVLRLWTERLYAEYANIIYQYRVRLRTPVIRIESVTGVWGQWAPLTRTLTISRRLIDEYPWDVVIEVLKHEMAHQLVNEVLGVPELHGPHFRRACDRLGVAEWAAAASGELPRDIPHWKDRHLSEDEERLLKRVEKLLSLATSANEHEAALAMQRVRQLYAKYNIERIESRRPSAMVYCLISRRKKRIETVESMIFSILTEHFFVRAIFTAVYDAADCTDYKAVELLGTRENVLMAEYVYHFLWNKVHALCKDYQSRTAKSGVRARRSYMLGVLAGFRDKLAADAAGVVAAAAESGRPEAQCRALLDLGSTELREFVGYRYPKLGSRKWGSGAGDHSSFEAGVADGKTITLHRGLTRTDGNLGLKLTSGGRP